MYIPPADTITVVGLERTFYNVSEDVGVVEVCAIVYNSSNECVIQFPFNVNISTTGMHYISQTFVTFALVTVLSFSNQLPSYF